jgi:DNA polymerase I-like protein with 3'-5' exonuclease and polymerase domains
VLNFFREREFFSLAGEEAKQLNSWKDLWLKVQLIWDIQWLVDLEKLISQQSEIVLDTETSSLNIMEAELVWVSVYIDDENIYYINRLHNWPKASDTDIKNFIQNILDTDILIIGHNIKYDLEILELFLKTENKINKQESDSQMSFGI